METITPGWVVRRISIVWGFIPLAFCAMGCSNKPATTAAKAESPAKVTAEKPPGEADLVVVTIKLKPEAETRLKILTGTIEKKPIPRTMSRAGDVMVPPGRSSIVSAPQTGTLVASEGEPVPVPGLAVKKGQALFTLQPIPSADRTILTPAEQATFNVAKADAEGQLKIAKPRFDNAKDILDRTEKLARSRDVPPSALDDARNAYATAKATLEAAEMRFSIFQKALGTGIEDAGKLTPLPLRAPADGIVINVPVQVGQQVPAGSILFEVANLDPVYVKVPVFVGEEESITLDKDAGVGGIADAAGKPTRPAKSVRTTPSANALTTTVDLYYEVENHDGKLRPGQKVGVTLPMKGEVESLVAPYAAVLYDLNGGAWVYESLGGNKYARRRVIVDRVIGPEAILAMGPKPGTKVVTDGAAELFGTEFGGSK